MHTLEIEQGRYKNKPRDKRLCRSCNQIENKNHFLLKCSLFQHDRSILLKKIVNETVQNFINLNDDQKFIYLMTCEDKEIVMNVEKYVCNSFREMPLDCLPAFFHLACLKLDVH